MRPARLPAPMVIATGLVSGWGRGLEALPDHAEEAAAGRPVIAIEGPVVVDDRFRRASRECRLAVAAVEEMLRSGVPREALAGNRTALLYATLSAYGASNRAFIEGARATSLHFPYTAPSAVPAEVAIEFGITGPYVIFLGGAPAALSALWYAGTLLAAAECDRALVLAVETFNECADLYARGRWLIGRPLVEAAVAVLLEPGTGVLAYSEARSGRRVRASRSTVRRRLGEAFACGPLVELALARAAGVGPLDCSLTGAWRGTEAVLRWAESRQTWSQKKFSTS